MTRRGQPTSFFVCVVFLSSKMQRESKSQFRFDNDGRNDGRTIIIMTHSGMTKIAKYE